ncbi:MAG: hypothetical protein Q7R89_02175 [bacterium]|nr:hypothetical protein [bacterium]
MAKIFRFTVFFGMLAFLFHGDVPAAKTIYRVKFSQEAAVIYRVGIDACGYSQVFVHASDNLTRQKKQKPVDESRLWVQLYRFDWCQWWPQATLDVAESVPLLVREFDATPNLLDAVINKTALVFNHAIGENVFVSINVALDGNKDDWGDYKSKYRRKTPNFTSIVRSEGRFVIAEVSGVITDGSNNLLDAVWLVADDNRIEKNKSGILEVFSNDTPKG